MHITRVALEQNVRFYSIPFAFLNLWSLLANTPRSTTLSFSLCFWSLHHRTISLSLNNIQYPLLNFPQATSLIPHRSISYSQTHPVMLTRVIPGHSKHFMRAQLKYVASRSWIMENFATVMTRRRKKYGCCRICFGLCLFPSRDWIQNEPSLQTSLFLSVSQEFVCCSLSSSGVMYTKG